MAKAKDITGQKFGRLTAIKFCYSKSRKKATDHYWLFRCDCGKEKILLKSSVTSGHIKSCGCYHKEKISIIHKKHGLANSRIYGIWCDIKTRCKNPKHIRHNYYYDKGINICDEWTNNFENFYNWALENGYKESLSIDRIDVNGNYCPENCRWVNNKIQSNNKTNNHNITVNGITHTISEWCDIKQMNYHTFYSRLNRGWNIEKILNTKIRGKKC